MTQIQPNLRIRRPGQAGLRPVLIIIVVVVAGFGVVRVAASPRMTGSVGGARVQRRRRLIEVEPGRVEVEIPPDPRPRTSGRSCVDAGRDPLRPPVRDGGATPPVSTLSLKSGTYELITGIDDPGTHRHFIAGPRVRGVRRDDPRGSAGHRDHRRPGRGIGDRSGRVRPGVVLGTGHDRRSTTSRPSPPSPTGKDCCSPTPIEFSEQSTRPADILNRLANTMQQRMDAVDWSAFEAAGFTRYEGIIIASLIESEVRWPRSDRSSPRDPQPAETAPDPRHRRHGALRPWGSGIPAEIDVTFDSPYNTRRSAAPARSDLRSRARVPAGAAANPADTEFRYYVLAARTARMSSP
jgi:hypothetical protein